MALSLEPEKIMAECRAHMKARDAKLLGALDLVQRYPGQWWDGAVGPEAEVDGENTSFEFVSQIMGQLVWQNPRWRCSTRRPRAQQMVAEAIQFGMNRWTVDSDIKTTLEDLAVDYSFCWGVGHVTVGPRPESYEPEDPILWPQLSRISPADFGFDSRAPSWRRARILFHDYRIDKNDLEELARLDRERPREERTGWNLEAIHELNEVNSQDARTKLWLGARSAEEQPERHQVSVREVYLPTHRLPRKPGPEEGFNGTILTLGTAGTRDGTALELRPPRPFYGPRWGPYTLLGCYIVPDCPFPLAALMAGAGNIEQASRISKAVDRQVEAYKRLLLVSAGDNELAQRIKSGKTDHVYHARQVQDVDKMVRALELGGTTAPNLQAEMRAIGKRNRVLGLDDVQRGNVTGEGTATEVQLAVESSLGRQGYVKGRFQDGVRRVGRTVAWYLYHVDEITFPLGPDAIEALGLDPEQDDPWFEGGSYGEGSGATFDDLGLEIEPYSMERPSETFLRQRGELMTNLIQLAPALAMLKQAGGDPKAILDAYGDSYGYHGASRLFPGIEDADPSLFQPDQAQPRLGRDSAGYGLPIKKALGGAVLGASGRTMMPYAGSTQAR